MRQNSSQDDIIQVSHSSRKETRHVDLSRRTKTSTTRNVRPQSSAAPTRLKRTEPAPARETEKREKTKEKKSGKRVLKYIGRFFVLLLTLVLLAVYAVYATAKTIAHGPSESLRNQLVLMSLQASATKWAPGLFFSQETIDEILNASATVKDEKIDISDIKPRPHRPEDGEEDDQKEDWSQAIDGILYESVRLNGFKAYVILVNDPSRLFVGVSSDDFSTAEEGLRIWAAADRYQATIVMNAGEFRDPGGVGTGAQPMGLTYSKGECVWDDGITNHTFIGFDENNRLIVSEGMTKAAAKTLGIRDGVMFQTGNILLTNDGTQVTAHRKSADAGTAQRTAIGQRADGTMIMIVTDGRTASSIGATFDDMLELMLSYGAVTAAMLDGGSSSLLYYRNYAELLGIAKDTLDTYQQMGILNKYKAFTYPRRLPTFFMVAPGGNGR